MLRADWDLPMVAAMNRYWRTQPPTHLLLAAFVGYKPEETAEVSQDDDTAAESVQRSLRDLGGQLPTHLKTAAEKFLAAPPSTSEHDHG